MRAALERARGLSTPFDALLAAVLVVAAVAETLGNADAPHAQLRALTAALAVSSVAVRRTFPVTATIVFGTSMATESLAFESPDEFGVLLALLFISYSIAVHAPRRESVLGGLLLVMALAITIATDPSDSVSNIAPSALLFVGLPFALGIIMRRRKLDVAALTLRTESLEHDAEAAVDAERRRIARELHDVVSHAVTLIAVQAEAGQTVIDVDPDAAKRALDAIGRVSRDALDELSRLLVVLRADGPAPDHHAGLAGLPLLVEGVRAAGLTVALSQDGTPDVIDPAVDACAFRVVQEGLTNALRHSSDARVDVHVSHGAELEISVHSTGRTHVSAYGGTGRGLMGLRERVAGLGGTLVACDRPDGSFELRVVLPRSIVGGAGS